MADVKVQVEKRDSLGVVTKILASALGVLVLMVAIISYNNPGITGYSVFQGMYGGASEFIIIALLAIVIFLYVRVHQK